MKAVIPAAKKKAQMFPFSESRPTATMPVMGTPLVKHLVHELRDIGVDEIYIVTNYREDMFSEEFGDHKDVETVHQEELNGTGGAVAECNFIDDDFLVVNGDVLVTGEDLEKLVSKHESTDGAATVLATDENRPEKFGVLSIKNDRVDSIHEKPEEPENPLINTGVYMFTPEIFDRLQQLEGEKHLTDAVSLLVENGSVRFELAENHWIDIGMPEKLWKADQIRRENEINESGVSEEATVHETASIVGDAIVEEGAEIKPGTVIEGKVFIGKNAVIGPNSVVKDSTVSRGSIVRDATVEDTLVFEDNIVDPHTHIENSIMGEESDVKSGTVIRQSFIGARSFIDMNNSIRGKKFVPDARTDLGEISK